MPNQAFNPTAPPPAGPRFNFGVRRAMTRMARLGLGVAFAAILVPLPAWVAWQAWRANTLRAFCADVRPGISLADLYRLEERHWISDSYLTEALLPDYVGQAHTPELTFRSHPLDPDFECAISHNGTEVTAARLVE